MMRTLWLAGPAALLLANPGCLKVVTFRTIIEQDGSVERFVKIESRDAPDVDSDLRLPDKRGWQQYKKEPKRFEARGKFKSVDAIPLDFEKTVDGPGDQPFKETSKSLKRYRAFSCALFTVHTYTERITDVTSREEFDAAIEEAINLRTMGYKILEKVYGDEFDLAPLKAYVDKEVVPRFRRLAAGYWEARLDKSAHLDQRLSRCVEALLGELGVKVDKEKDGTIDLNDTFGDWFPRKLSDLVPLRKGGKLTPEQWKTRLKQQDELGNKNTKAVAKALVLQRFGTEKAFEEHVARHGLRLVGAYLQLLAHQFNFDATVIMPGQIVETNGLINDNEVSWSFSHEQIFPYYEMRVRSVAFAPANDLEDGRSIITSPRNAVLLADFGEQQNKPGRQRLLAAIQDLAKDGKPTALRALCQGEEAIKGLDKLLEKIGFAE